MGTTKIEWCETSWNPVHGCSPVSAGCENCYARRMANRLRGRHGYPMDDPFAVTLRPDRLDEPLRWRKPRRVFVCSMGDLFHEDVPAEFIDKVLARAVVCPQHTFILLTKRAKRFPGYFVGDGITRRTFINLAAAHEFGEDRISEALGDEVVWPLPNVWLGVSVEDQSQDHRICDLLDTPAAVRFVSYEPALGPVNFAPYLFPRKSDGRSLDWLIAGGESGPGARPAHPDWFRAVRDECDGSGTPFFFKQWGEWLHLDEASPCLHYTRENHDGGSVELLDFAKVDGKTYHDAGFYFPGDINSDESGPASVRVGKKVAGRRLDGVIHEEWPQ